MKTALMCKPDYFEVKYSINPWMKNEIVDKNLAFFQWNNYKNALESSGVRVETINPHESSPDMVFAADQAVTIGGKTLISNFKYKQRREESGNYKKWFVKNNFNLKFLPENVYFEGGGESAWVNNKLLIGTGFRTSLNACEHIQKILDVEVTCLELINPNFYHLDTCLFVLNNETAFYYPNAFSKKANMRLKKLFNNLIKITKTEVFNFAANSVVLNNNVFMQKNNKSMKNKIDNLGYKTHELDFSEFMKSGGGAHCLVQFIN